MTLSFEVEEDCLCRDFLRAQAVSAGLTKAVKRADGFFADGAPVRTNERLRAGQTLSFTLPPEPPGAAAPEDLPLTILFENEHAMVLVKPAGQTVHPTLGYAGGTLANAFAGLMARRGTPRPFRPINRLDRGTSGLVLCAMNAYAAPILAAGARKEYLALVQGAPTPPAGAWTAPIQLEDGSIIKRCCAPGGKPSRTEYETLCRGKESSLLRCVTVTGRTHQIRVHAAFAGHPLLGDGLYGGPCEMLARPALHCGRITVQLPGETAPRVFACPPPLDMERLIFFNDMVK